MRSQQTRALQTFRRVEAWFAEHPQVIPASGTSAAALSNQVDALKQVVASMTARAAEQASQTGQATLAAKDEATQRHQLRSLHLRAIVRVAGALRGRVPGMGLFKLPKPRLSSDTLVHAAEAMRSTAAVYKDVFVEHGLPADFLDQLDAATTALGASVDARGVARSRVSGASSGLVSDLAMGKQIVAMIDASLAHALKADSPMLASWRQAKRTTVKAVTNRGVVETVPAVASAASRTDSGVPVVASVTPVVATRAPVVSTGVQTSDTVVPVVDSGESPTLGTVTPVAQQESRAA
jgi:hypothetical protein